MYLCQIVTLYRNIEQQFEILNNYAIINTFESNFVENKQMAHFQIRRLIKFC